MKTHCVHGHSLDDRTVLVQTKLYHPNGRWYVVRSCRVCRSIAESLRWYFRKVPDRNGRHYRGAPFTVDEVVRRVERRWARRLGEGSFGRNE